MYFTMTTYLQLYLSKYMNHRQKNMSTEQSFMTESLFTTFDREWLTSSLDTLRIVINVDESKHIVKINKNYWNRCRYRNDTFRTYRWIALHRYRFVDVMIETINTSWSSSTNFRRRRSISNWIDWRWTQSFRHSSNEYEKKKNIQVL